MNPLPKHPFTLERRASAAWRWLGQPVKRLSCIFAGGLLGVSVLAGESSSSLTDSIQNLWKQAATSVQFGGFASQGFLVNTGHNDYLGDTSKGTADFREYGVNVSWSRGKFRVGAQAFGQKLGDYGDDRLRLDWAVADYQFAQWLGVRGGRVKTPRGLYNEALDLDSTRPFVLLPQSVYDARLRDFNASFDGGMLYGNVPLGKAGSLDYRIYYGDIPISTESGADDYFNNDVALVGHSIGMDSVIGGSAFWNTPLDGLRVGYSYSSFENLAAARNGFLQLYPEPAPPTFLDGSKSTRSYARHLFSIEYIKGDWVFAAEAGRDQALYNGFIGGEHLLDLDFKSDYCYVSVARRINRWLELGTYYSYSRDVEPIIGNLPFPTSGIPALKQGDFALSARFDLNEHLIFKVEGHYMDGSGKIFDTVEHPQPVANRDDSWFLFAAKVTYSF